MGAGMCSLFMLHTGGCACEEYVGNKTTFDGMMVAVANEKHPLQSKLTFVFTDFAPNANKQGVPRSEAANICDTGLYMPVKVHFDGRGVGRHEATVPIGPITMMQNTGDRIIGEAIVWRDEFPDVVEYLEKASAEEGGVQFSWEIYYGEAEIDDSGIQWLHDCIVAGHTIVDKPAYKGRTPLLAIAQELTMEELQAQIQSLTEKLYTMLDGLYNAMGIVQEAAVLQDVSVDEQYNTLMEKVRELHASYSALQAQAANVAELEVVAGPSLEEFEALKTEVAELREFKQSAEASAARVTTLNARATKLREAGIAISADELARQSDFIVSLTDDAFTAYVNSISGLLQKATSSRDDREVIPDPLTSNTPQQISTAEIAAGLRELKKKR